VYATCSSEPDENEGVVDAFLATTPAFAPIDVRSSAPGVPRSLVDERGHLKTAPHRDALDAFFGAVFERRVL
jgi:16S rRNA (cytosine967-C5)-methyltransferase